MAYAGDIHNIIYLHDIGCEWNYLICKYALLNNNIDCFEYAYNNNCIIDDKMTCELII